MPDFSIELQKQIDRLQKQLNDLSTRDKPANFGCVVYRNSAQAFTGTAALSWNASIKNDHSMWDVAAPTRMIAPITGWYVAGGCFLYASSEITSSGVRIGSSLQVNSGAFIFTGPVSVTTSGVDIREPLASAVYLTAGDYVELIVNQGFGVSKSLQASVASNITGNSGYLVKL